MGVLTIVSLILMTLKLMSITSVSWVVVILPFMVEFIVALVVLFITVYIGMKSKK